MDHPVICLANAEGLTSKPASSSYNTILELATVVYRSYPSVLPVIADDYNAGIEHGKDHCASDFMATCFLLLSHPSTPLASEPRCTMSAVAYTLMKRLESYTSTVIQLVTSFELGVHGWCSQGRSSGKLSDTGLPKFQMHRRNKAAL